MKLSKIYIDNFRNLKKFLMTCSEFEVLVGENNIGKTNIMHAINKVLSFDRKGIYFDNEDFSSAEKPIIIELTFNDFTSPEEEAIFFDHEGIKNPQTDEVKVRLRAEWDENERDINVNLLFIREDLPEEEQEIKEFSWHFRRLIPSYYIPAQRQIEREITSKRGDLFEILQSFTPHQIMPIQTLKGQALAKIDNLRNEADKIELKELDTFLKELKAAIGNVEEYPKEEVDSLKEKLETIKKDIKNDDKIEERVLLERMFSQVKEVISILQNRISIQSELLRMKKEFKKLYGLEDLENRLNDLLCQFLANENLTLDTISAKDEDFLRQLNIDIGEYSILKYGSGYQSLLSIILKLFKSIYQVINRDDAEYRSFVVALEEPETHLHPHLQRHFVKALKNIQKKFSDEGISLQFIISTHSPFIVTPLLFENLIFLRRGDDISPYAIKLDKKKFSEEIVNKLNLTDVNIKRRKNKQIIKWLDFLVYECLEIFFCKSVIIGEGSTEQGAIPLFAEKIRKSLDQFGISFLNGEGDSLIYPLKLLSALKILWVLVADKDKAEMLESFIQPELKSNIFITETKAFESEIILKSPLEKLLQALDLKSLPERNLKRIANLKGKFSYLKDQNIISLLDLLIYLKEDDLETFKHEYVLGYLKDEKGLSLGRILGELLDEDEIPLAFVNAIRKAVEISRI